MASGTKRGIGRGLSAILPEAAADAAGELRELPVELIKPNPEPAADQASTPRR